MPSPETFTAFVAHRVLAAGDLATIADALVIYGTALPAPQVFDDATGRPIELDLRGGAQAATAEYRARTAPPDTPARQGRGRPRLGVVAREVTLLPRHWDWLAGQPGGASAALRRLVETARLADAAPSTARQARDAAYNVMFAVGGDLPGFEDASRALFAGDLQGLEDRIATWPPDLRQVVLRLATPG